MRIRTQIIAIMVLIILLVMIPLIIFLNYQIKTMILSNEEENSYENLDSTNLLAQNYINTVLARMENLAKEPEIIEASISKDDKVLAGLSDKFSTIVDTSATIENIGFQDENCIGIVADKKAMQAIKGYKGYDFSSRVYCQPTIKTQKTYISPAYISLASKQPVISVTASVFSGGKMEGFIIGIVNVADLHTSLSGLKKENYLILIDKEGSAFIDTRYRIKEIKIEKNLSEVLAVNDKLKGSEQGTFESGENIISFKKYKDYSIILVKPKESVLAIQTTVFNIMMYSLIFVILLIVVASFLFSRIITKPIENLTKKVNDVTTGNLSIQLEKGETQEIQSLTDSLNRILASMKLAILRTGASKGELGLTEAIEAKEQAENKFKLLYETSSDAIMTLEPPTWKFTSGNPATVKMFSCKDEKQFISLGPWEVSPEKQPDGQLSSDKAKKMIERAMKEGSNFFEWTHKRYKGDNFPATVLLTKVKEGEKEYLQATVRDLSQQKIDENKSKLIEASKNIAIGRQQILGRREHVAKEREEVVGEREKTATGREEIVGRRERVKKGEGREGIALGREEVVGEREKTATGRERVIGKREEVAKEREEGVKNKGNKAGSAKAEGNKTSSTKVEGNRKK